MVLLRRVLGDALRARRQAQHRTLREVSGAANVSLGYLSEIERGQKEASSELLAAICYALGAQLSELLREVSDTLELAELAESTPLRDAAPAADLAGDSAAGVAAGDSAARVAAGDSAARVAAGDSAARVAAGDSAARVAVADGLSVAVHRDGPLKTTLRATRNAAPAVGPRREVVHAA